MAPEVGFVGASRCFLDTYDEYYSICQDHPFILGDYPNDHIQNSLLKILLTAKFRADFSHFSRVELQHQFFHAAAVLILS